MNSGPLRLAVIGVGDVAYRDYLPEFGRIAELGKVSLVVARNRARVEKAAEDFGVDRVATDWREALGDDIDAVINLTPAPVHGEINLALAKAGRHFYSEKPYALTVGDGQAIRAAAKSSGAVIAAAPSIMVYPQIKAAAEVLASGEIGRVHSVRGNCSAPPPPWGGFIGDYGPFFSSEVGPLSDLGVYPFHAIVGLLGEAKSVSAMSHRSRDSFDVDEGPYAGTVKIESDDNWQITMRLAGDILASVQVSFCIKQPDGSSLEICGDAGWIKLSLLDPGMPLLVNSGGKTREIDVNHERMNGPDHVLGVRDFLQSIRDQRPPVIGVDPALHVLAVREAAIRSSATGSAIDISTIVKE